VSALRTRTLLICNGEPPRRALLRSLARRASLVVAADGGANAALRAGVLPGVVIGDCDSLLPATARRLTRARIIRVARQDNTDMEKALDFIAAEAPSRVVIAGATGGRIDFTLGNLAVFWNYTDRLPITFVGDGWRAVPVGRRRRERAKRGVTVSLIPFGDCAGITLRGLKYALKDAPMRVGEIGVSNVVAASPFTVEVRRGRMLMVIFDGAAGRSWPPW